MKLSKVPKAQAKDYYLSKLEGAVRIDDYKIKSMLAKAEFVDKDIRETYNCAHCKGPVYMPMTCKECGIFICQICRVEGNDRAELEVCPSSECDFQPFTAIIVQDKLLNPLN